MTKSYDLYKQVWAVHDIPKDVEYDDSVFTKQFEQKFGKEPDTVIREPLGHVVRIYVGPLDESLIDMQRVKDWGGHA